VFGPRGKVDPERHLIRAATGWGGNAPEDALWLTGVPAKNDGSTIHTLTMENVPVDSFWSISAYGADGYFAKNDRGVYSINNVTAKRSSDGSITIQSPGATTRFRTAFRSRLAGTTGRVSIARVRKY